MAQVSEGVSERDIRHRIETHYVDARGLERDVDPEAIVRVAAAMAGRKGLRASTRTVVARPGRGLDPPLLSRGALRWELRSDETVVAGEATSGALVLPDDLAIGTYQLTLAGRGRARPESLTLLRAPPRAFQGRGDGRMWAIAVQLYGVRSRRNWGHGDFTDLAALLDLAAGFGAAGIGLNPLHSLLDDDVSPYSPNSRLFLNPLYIDVDAVPEFPGRAVAGLEREIADLRGRELVDYAAVAKAKMAALRLAYERFCHDGGPRRQAFDRYRQECGPVLMRFACFEFLRRAYLMPWWEWPAPLRDPVAAMEQLSGTDEGELTFFAYMQWLAEQQLQACCRKARDLGLALGLYLDVAVGVRPDGFDAWNDQDAILPGLHVGAPPDPFNVAGQNWGLAAFNPIALESRAFEPFRAMLRASMRHSGAIRIDHVLGLKRLFLIPEAMQPDHGVYVRYPFGALLAVVAQESIRQHCIVIGEDLGTVPEGLRETLEDWGIWSYQVMLFERSSDGAFQPPESYRAHSLVTFSTHDLATFAGWVRGHDLGVKRSLGIDPGETDEERRDAQRELRRALAAHGAADLNFPAVARFLGGAPSRLLLVAIEDALGVCDQANVPATIHEHPNWRRRLPMDVEDLAGNPGLASVANAMTEAGRAA